MFQNKFTVCAFIFLCGVFLLIGCAYEKTETARTTLAPTSKISDSATRLPTRPPTKTFTPKPSTTPTQTQTATLSPTPSSTPTKIISPTPRPTLPPSPTPTLEPVELLADRYPTIDNLEAYLLDVPDGYFKTTSFDREYLINEFRNRGLTTGAELIYQDINGDGVADLIVSDRLTVAIFLWLENRYSAPFILVGSGWKYAPSSKVTLEDWTNDGIPEIIFDYRGDAGGTGISFNVWDRFIPHSAPVSSCFSIFCEPIELKKLTIQSIGVKLFAPMAVLGHRAQTGLAKFCQIVCF